MAISQGEEKLATSVQEAQNSANIQSANNIVTLKKYFGPRLESLAQAIEHASDSSGKLSKVIIGVTIVGVVIAALQWYSEHADSPDYSSFSDKQLECVIGIGKGQSDKMLEATIEFCKREFSK